MLFLYSTVRFNAFLLLVGLCALLPCSVSWAAEDTQVSDERLSTTIKEDAYSTTLDDSKSAQSKGRQPLGEKNAYTIGELSGVYGASAMVTFRWYRDLDNQDSNPDFLRWALQEKGALWTSIQLQGWQGYVRGSMSNVDRGVGPTYTGIGADVEGPTLELAFFSHSLPIPNGPPSRVTLGRQLQYVGRGLSYFAVSDGVQVDILGEDWTHKYFAAKTLPRQDNIDFSVPGFDKEGDRFFYGAEWVYTRIQRLSVYGYIFGQEDESHENPDMPSQSFHYDSFYYGTGFAANPFGQLRLWGEMVGETGQGYTDARRSRLQQTDVDAWAWILGGKHSWDIPMKPVIEMEAAYGSGDPDRNLVTNTINGSTDAIDTNFLYFGYYAAGYAFQPRLSNLYVYSIGGNLQPLENSQFFKQFMVGTKAYLFFKDEEDGGTSDFESDGRDQSLGSEWDAYVHWQMTQSLLWSFRYGIFMPGDGFAPDTQEPTQYFYTRLKWDY